MPKPRWTSRQLLKHLRACPTGLASLAFLADHRDKLQVWRTGHIRNWYREPPDTSWWEYYAFGLTSDREGDIRVYLSARMDAFTAAATFVHEMEHARGWITGQGGDEVDARFADMRFYLEHGALDRLPEEYFRKGIVVAHESGHAVDETRLRLESATVWNAQSAMYEYKDYEFGALVRIDADLV